MKLHARSNIAKALESVNRPSKKLAKKPTKIEESSVKGTKPVVEADDSEFGGVLGAGKGTKLLRSEKARDTDLWRKIENWD